MRELKSMSQIDPVRRGCDHTQLWLSAASGLHRRLLGPLGALDWHPASEPSISANSVNPHSHGVEEPATLPIGLPTKPSLQHNNTPPPPKHKHHHVRDGPPQQRIRAVRDQPSLHAGPVSNPGLDP